MTTLQLIQFGLPLTISLVAIIMSAYSIFKSVPPVDIRIENPSYLNGLIGYYDSNMNFVTVISDSHKHGDEPFEFIVFHIRIVNPRSYPISIFNIQILDEHNNKLPYYKQLNISYMNNINKLIATDNSLENKVVGITLPYSHYQTIESGSFSHVDLVVCKEDVEHFNSNAFKIFFRDSRRTLFQAKHPNVKSDIKLKYPIHFKEFLLCDILSNNCNTREDLQTP